MCGQAGNLFATDLQIRITKPYLNIPVGNSARMKLVKITGKSQREFPVQLAEGTVDYWIFVNVTEFLGQTITLSCPANVAALSRIYQDNQINGTDSLYKESNRPQFHFTVKRGWSNDINGPIFFNNTFHLFWQAFPFGNSWNTGFMYWGHATSKDMLHWKELSPALMLDSLGSPWSGTAVIDHHNDGGWGKDAMVLYYTAFDRLSGKQVQCIAYSLDQGKTFTRYSGNPVIDSNQEVRSNDTRDPKVFYYNQAKIWVMVLFEIDGMSFYNSKDMKKWTKESHFSGLHECPDFFELAVEGNPNEKKWILHGASSDYFIGTFDGQVFHPESSRLKYAEGAHDFLYAAESFGNMPSDRRIQIAWGRIEHAGMPFTQMMLFPTEFKLKLTKSGLRLMASPIKEIENLHASSRTWASLSWEKANQQLEAIKPGPLHITFRADFSRAQFLKLFYQGREIVNLMAKDFPKLENDIDILIDKTVMEVFINDGVHYIVRKLDQTANMTALRFQADDASMMIKNLKVHQMKSIW
ncbi:glycoside hydrolase family 32 protein [Pedobacter sp. HMWF019]|uniref:glycoside hydrolase family 32 protein n=1 Tax=Pedobacter sp. HMWF019 TaxID=2056856 RepID=UPI00130487B8|nr:glycoside hydrolase family 32 protein [Pedobacter sp. HMWF019]